MPTEKAETEEYEYHHLEWRAFQEEEVRAQLRQLLADGWELDGPEGVKAGMFADLYWQKIKRRKDQNTSDGNI